jgi:hypothetical protein
MTNLTKTALSMATQDIKFNRLLFGKRTTLADVRRIYELCIAVARKVEAREGRKKYKEGEGG